MIFNDSLAYVPLFVTMAVSLVIFILLIVIKNRSTARVSFVSYIASLGAAAGCLTCAIINLNTDQNLSQQSETLILFALIILGISLLILPYCIILSTFEPKKIEKLVPPSENIETAPVVENIETHETLEVSESEEKALAISKDFIIKAQEAIATENGMTDLLNYVNTTIKDGIHADGGAILMIDDFDDIITVKSFDGDFPPPYKLPDDMPHKPVRVATNFKFASFPLRDNIFGEIATSGKPELITNPENDNRIYQNGPEEFLECGSYIIVPMKINEIVIGVAAFARNHANEPFNEDELKFASTISDFAASTIKNVITVKDTIEHNDIVKEAGIAAKIQAVLHPAKLPIIKGIQIGSIWNPAEGVCGDYYDIIPSRKDRISFVMSDVAGKGINSVIVMSMLRAMLRLVVNTKKSAATILEWVNHGIAGESFSTDHFASCALINYDPEAKKLEIATGGTTPVYYYNIADASITKLSNNSEPIGVDKGSTYKDVFQEIKNGDIIVTYTDGMVESLNAAGEQYSKESLFKIIKLNSKSSSKDIANLIKADIKKFCGAAPQHDDQSLLVIKF